MALQDDYIKTALRLPRELHARLLDAARESSKSLNAELVARLETSFARDRHEAMLKEMLERQEAMQRGLSEMKKALDKD